MSTRVGVDRAVEIIHDAGEGHRPRYRVGSGFLVGGAMVLTAGHVVGDGQLMVRLDGSREYEAALRKRGNVDPGPDLALVEITDVAFGQAASPLHFASVDRSASEDIEGCWAVGFPAFKERQLTGTKGALRDMAHLRGRIAPGANRISGLLELEVTATPRPIPKSILGSEWEGISGTVVFVPHRRFGGLVVGVIAKHHRPEGSSSLTVVPITAIVGLPDAAEWWELLGEEDPEHLVLLPQGRDHDTAAYRATVADLVRRTTVLYNRDAELVELASFATGGGAYCWLIGGPWAGKTALAAHLTSVLGPDVDWVAYFLVRRQGDADSTRFLTVVNDQLARLLGEDPPIPPDDLHAFRMLWERVTTKVRGADRHLLLIVDGLDEDVSWKKELPSVASFLPTLVGSHAHVTVTSRPYPELPGDVDVDHPLRQIRPVILQPSDHARELKDRANQELKALLSPRGGGDHGLQPARDLLCVLAAAEGPLSFEDLAAVSGYDLETTEAGIQERVARVVQPVGSAKAERFTFAHETLREASEGHFSRLGRLTAATERILEWAESWRTQGWPIEETPIYLLEAYPDMLVRRNSHRLRALAEDLAYVEAAVARIGVDRTIGILSLAGMHRSRDQTTPLLLRLVLREAHHLRDPKRIRRLGYTRQQLCLAAMAASDVELAEAARREIERLPGPQLPVRWTTARLSAALGYTLTGHTNSVNSVAVTPDGTGIVSGGADGTVRVWDLATGAPLGQPLTGHSGSVSCVAVTPDGTGIVSGGGWDSTIRVWDLATGAPLGEPLTGHTDSVSSVAVTPDGTGIVSGAWDSTIRVWDLATGAPLGEPLTGHIGRVSSVAVTPDGTRIVSSGSDHTIRVWDLATGAPLGEPLTGHIDAVYSVALTPDGTTIVSGGSDHTIRVWDLATGAPLGEPLTGHIGRVSSVAVTPDGTRIVSGGSDHTIRVWDLTTGAPLGEPLTDHSEGVSSVALTPAGIGIVSGGWDHTIRVWDLATGAPLGEPLTGHTDPVSCVAVTPDGTRVVSCGSWDNTIRVWDLATGAPLGQPLTGHTDWVSSVAVTPDGTGIVSGGADGTVRVWDLATGAPLGQPLTGHSGSVSCVAVTPDGTGIVSGGGWDSTIRVWDLATGAPLGQPLTGHTDSVSSVAVTPDGTGIVSGAWDSTIRVWDLATGAPLGEPLTGHIGRVSSVAVTPDGTRILSGSGDGTVRVWDLATGAPLRQPLTGHSGSVYSVAVTPDGARVVSGSDDGTVRVWDLATGECLLEVACFEGVTAIAAGPAGEDGCAVVGGDRVGSVTAWTLKNS